MDGYGTANFVKKEVASGGALFDMGVYHISQMLYLLGQRDAERIKGDIVEEGRKQREKLLAAAMEAMGAATGLEPIDPDSAGVGAKVALSRTWESVLSTPMQLGPTMRMSAFRTSSSSCAASSVGVAGRIDSM